MASADPIIKQTAIRWHLLLMPLCFIPVVTYWIIGPTYIAHWQTFVLATLLNFTLTGCCVLTLDYLNRRVVRRYPSLDQTVPRVWRSFLVFLTVTPLFLLGGTYLYSHFHLFGYQHEPGLTARILLCNVGANMLSVGIEETVYSLTKWREMAIEREELRKVNLQSQYESLKQQVNPHFLFNSLNTLSSLIAHEPQQAEEFVVEMARVYRYLLLTNSRQSNQPSGNNEADGLTSLETELGFIQSYFHLLKTRYQAGIDLKTDVPSEYLAYRIPPLTLQMLIENAVKHNIVSVGKPLLIEIMIQMNSLPARLTVRNNLQRKNTRLGEASIGSNQIGLTNIAAKYRLLGQPEPIIQDNDGYFSIVLPLFMP